MKTYDMNCIQCNTNFNVRYKEQKFCSHKCCAIFNNKKRGFKSLKQCKYCNNKMQDRINAKFCSIICRQQFNIKFYNLNPTKHLPSFIRKLLLEKSDFKCSNIQCKWEGFNPITKRTTLQIDHINGNSEDNSINNLRVLCPNCHSLTPTWMILNRGNGRRIKNKIAE